ESTSTRARYYAAAGSFTGFLLKHSQPRVLSSDPLAQVERPSNAESRERYMPFADARRVLDAMPNAVARNAVALALCSAMERSALELASVADVIDPDERTLYARGTKNGYRSRYIIVDEWAWQYVEEQIAGKLPSALLFDGVDFNAILDEFYDAQIALGMV